LKLQIDNLEFHYDHFYIQSRSIVEKIVFNNRTLYSKFKKQAKEITPILLEQHRNNEINIALPLIEKEKVNYVVIEYAQEDWKYFYALLQHLFKSLNMLEYTAYRDTKKELLQIFISKPNTPLEEAYKEIENIKHLLLLKSEKSYKIFPNLNLPKNYNIISLPTQKI
jgi:hypothetical protein